MARITREARAKKKQILDDYIWELFCNEGWEAITYQRLADKLETRKSTIQRYYPSSTDFISGLEGRVLPMIAPHLDFTDPRTFMESWRLALKEPIFRNSSQLFIVDAVQGIDHRVSKLGFSNVRNKLIQEFGEENIEALMREATGIMVLNFLEE